eukprot:12735458-Ditylum_brightwellii.AAC.2
MHVTPAKFNMLFLEIIEGEANGSTATALFPLVNVLALLFAYGHDTQEHLVLLKHEAVELHVLVVL